MKLTNSRCQCSGKGCGEYFNSLKAFDRHRVGTYQPNARRCLTVDEMQSRGMSKNPQGFWITGKKADSSLRQIRTNGDQLKAIGEQGV